MERVEARKLLIETYEETGSFSETARQWQTWRHVVRKWVRRYRAEGDDISTYLTMACHPEDGIDLLARYSNEGGENIPVIYCVPPTFSATMKWVGGV